MGSNSLHGVQIYSTLVFYTSWFRTHWKRYAIFQFCSVHWLSSLFRNLVPPAFLLSWLCMRLLQSFSLTKPAATLKKKCCTILCVLLSSASLEYKSHFIQAVQVNTSDMNVFNCAWMPSFLWITTDSQTFIQTRPRHTNIWFLVTRMMMPKWQLT